MTLDSYPTVTDFVVRVATRDGASTLEYASESRGRLASFPAWEHADRDLRHFTPADVPLGTFDAPYEDTDEEDGQQWRLSIFEEGGWVYVEENERRFRVPTDRYLRAWAAVIDRYNPVEPMDQA